MRNSKSWIGYIIYLIILIGYLAGSHLLLTHLNAQAQMKFDMRPYLLGSTVVYVLLGVILGFDHLYKQIKKEGSWKVNVSKIILLGIPAAFLLIGRIFAFLVGADGIIAAFIIELATSGSYIPTVLGILLGYTVISSFEKVTPKI